MSNPETSGNQIIAKPGNQVAGGLTATFTYKVVPYFFGMDKIP